MVKINGPLFSEGSSGALGEHLIFSNCKGVNYVKKFAAPANPNSARQFQCRTIFSDAIEAWQELDSETKSLYNYRSQKLGISGYNLFVKEYLETHKGELPMSVGLIPVGGIIPIDLDLIGTRIYPPAEFAACNGSVCNDPESPFYGISLPNLNATNRFLRGDTISGSDGGSATHTHSTPGANTGTPSGTVGLVASGSITAAAPTHTHTVAANNTGASSTTPLYHTVVWYIRIK